MTDINFEGYKAKKTKGLWSMVKTSKGIAIQRKQFDVDSGEEIAPVLEYIDLATAQDIESKLQKRLNDIKLLVIDATAL